MNKRDDHIFVMNKDKAKDKKPHDASGLLLEETGFTSGKDAESKTGVKEITTESPKCYAKWVKLDAEEGITDKYYVKYGSKGFMYDPWGLYSEGTESKKSYGDTPDNAFRRVNKKSFFYYMDYLKSRNKAWLNNAEREAINGY
tara:strand:+ start:4061 stop:4489 length:429 start_codon:yes stop_codon:yes gene_type:complete